MTPAPALFRKSFLLLCAASWGALSFSASAENGIHLTECVGVACNDFTTWTLPYVRQLMMITDEQLKSSVAANSLGGRLEKIFSEFSAPDPEAYAAAKNRLAGILAYAQAHAAEMGIAMPEMYVSTVATQATQTSEGTIFIPVDRNAFRLAVLTDAGAQRLKLALDRELAHIRNGDTSPSGVALHHNNPASSREAGLRAEIEAAGPLGAKDPIAATTVIEFAMREEFQTRLMFAKGNTVDDIDPNRLSDRDYKRISDEHERAFSDHSTFAPWDRIVALRKEAGLMSEYEQTHAVRSHADREAESKWLVAQILPDAMWGGR
jgi:hypothetical protein